MRRQPHAAVAWLALMLALAAGCGGGQPRAAPSSATTTPSASAPAPATTATATPAPTVTSARPSPTPRVPAALAGTDLTRIPTDRRMVALTFDAGANADGVPSILATLHRERVRATFFLTGDFVNSFPTQARAIASAGHRLGNHSVSHPHFPTLTAGELRAEVLSAERTITRITGADPRPLFRFPYGDRTPATIAAVNRLGYLAVRWTTDSLGWQGTTEQTVASVTARVLHTAQPGQILLMHVGSHPQDRSTLDADALPGVLSGLRQRGYIFVTLDALLTGAG